MSTVVLDTSALFAFLQQEKGAESVERYLESADCVMSTVNQAEFIGKMRADGVAMPQIEEILGVLPLLFVTFDSEHAVVSGELAAHARKLGLSLGDRACLALAKQRGSRAITADKVWMRLGGEVDIECIRS
jgi:ribonuclease VapC